MENSSKQVRNSCKALIVDKDKLLVIQKKDGEELYYVLPGGGQNHKETFIETINRECEEEIGTKPSNIKDLVFIREYIGINHEFSGNHKDVHQVEYMFECTVDSRKICMGSNVDEGQESIKWISLIDLEKENFYPKEIRKKITDYFIGKIKINTYLGDIN